MNTPEAFYPDGYWLQYYGVWYRREINGNMFDFCYYRDATGNRIYFDLTDLSPIERYVLRMD